MVPAHGYYRLSLTIQIHLPHGRTVFIKQAPFPIHRTLHENFGARHPSSVFFDNRFRSADCQKIQLPPGGSQGGLYEFAQSLAAPLWGKCRAAAKGVTLVTLSCNHSSNNTPSVSLAGSEEPSSLPAPPPGSRGIVRIRSRFHKNAGAYRTPQPLRRQLSSALSGCTPSRTPTPAKPFRGAWGFAPTPAKPFRGAFNVLGR